MTAISVAWMKTDETSEWAEYAFGGPPVRVLGHVILKKVDSEIEPANIVDEEFKYIIPAVMKCLTKHSE